MRSVDWRSLAKERGTSPLFVRVITAVITLTGNYAVITPPIFCCCVITRLYLRAQQLAATTREIDELRDKLTQQQAPPAPP